MPLKYIAGQMMVVRAETWPLKLIGVTPSLRPLKDLDETPFFIALTPAQAYDTLDNEPEKLARIPRILIGGGAISKELEERLLKVCTGEAWSSYGMTETLSHIALRRIGERYYKPLEGVSLSTDEEDCLIVDAPEICPERLHTNDRVELLSDGRFRVLGRRDNVVCSGGVKLQIEEIENKIVDSGLLKVNAFALTGIDDPRWGQALTLLTTTPIEMEELRKVLPSYECPKFIKIVKEIKLTETGKIRRADMS